MSFWKTEPAAPLAWLGPRALWVSDGAHADAATLPLLRHDEAEPDWSRSLAALKPDAAAQLLVADHWCRYWLVAPPAGVRSLAELQRLAQLRFEALFRHAAKGWHITADWSRPGPLLCCAVPLALQQALRTRPGAWRSAVPAAMHALRNHEAALRDASCVVVKDDLSLLLLVWRDGGMRHLRHWCRGAAHPGTVTAGAAALGAVRAQLQAWEVELPASWLLLGASGIQPDAAAAPLRVLRNEAETARSQWLAEAAMARLAAS